MLPGEVVRTSTGVAEFDRVLGGGLVSGQVVLLAGEPGVGKSTLLLTVAHRFALPGRTVLYVTGEESVEQVGVRARRTGATAEHLLVADETDLATILGHVEATDPALIVIDSVQTVLSAEVEGRAGGVAQVVEVTRVLTRVAKQRHVPLLMIGQSTRDNVVAGPRALEHLVDTLLTFEGERSTPLRLLRASKNRFGPADEVACFEQGDDGLNEVADPSSLFRAHREEPVAGTCPTVTVEGRRALLAEVQALVAPTNATYPRRGVTGLDPARTAMLIAVTEHHGHLQLKASDIYVATVAGMRLTDPATDLATCFAIATAAWGVAIPANVAAVGEIALSGDLRPVPGMARRISEATRLGFTTLLVPPGSAAAGLPGDVVEVSHLRRGLAALHRLAAG